MLKDTLDDYGVDIKKYERVRKPQEGEYYYFIIANEDGKTINKDGTPNLEPGNYTSETHPDRNGPYTIYYKNGDQLTYPTPTPPVLYTEKKRVGRNEERKEEERKEEQKTENPKEDITKKYNFEYN